MTENVRVSVCGVHVAEEAQEPIRTDCEGRYEFARGEHRIFYEEVEDGTGEAVKTRLTVSRPVPVQDADVRYVDVAKNSGGHLSRMRFFPERRQKADYQTPYGTIALETVTRDVRLEEGKDSLRVQIQYDLEMDGQRVSSCTLTVEVMSADPNLG